MFIINGIFGGLMGGILCAFLVALIATVPGLGPVDKAVIPVFYATAPLIALWLGMKTYPS